MIKFPKRRANGSSALVVGSDARAGDAEQGPPALHLANVSAWYGQARALVNVDMDLEAGGAFGLVGRNGAGKSTLLRSIARAHQKVEGSITMAGVDLIGRRMDEVAAMGVSLVREGSRVFEALTVDECLQAAGHLAQRRNRQPRALDEVFSWFPVLIPLRNRQSGYLSGGQRQALSLAMAFRSAASVLLLDEPSSGLHESVIKATFEAIANIAESGVTLLVAEQKVEWLQNLVQRVYVLETGGITDVVAPDQLKSIDVSWDAAST